MEVDISKTIVIDADHSIEFGTASWDSSVDSIRRRKNNSNGSFDPISSSEIPINGGFVDIGRLVCECLKHDKIGKKEMAEILGEIIDSAKRQKLTLTLM